LAKWVVITTSLASAQNPLDGKRSRNRLVKEEEEEKYRKMVMGLSLILSFSEKRLEGEGPR